VTDHERHHERRENLLSCIAQMLTLAVVCLLIIACLLGLLLLRRNHPTVSPATKISINNRVSVTCPAQPQVPPWPITNGKG
jgi:hypothetical protein